MRLNLRYATYDSSNTNSDNPTIMLPAFPVCNADYRVNTLWGDFRREIYHKAEDPKCAWLDLSRVCCVPVVVVGRSSTAKKWRDFLELLPLM